MIDTKNNALIQAIKQDLAKNRVYEKDVIEAIFIKKTSKGAFFDLGKFGTGIVYGLELLNAKDIIKNLKPGDKILAKILVFENQDGYVELSLVDADKQKNWQKIKELEESGEIIPMKIIGANSGGLIGEIFEIKAFLPISKLAEKNIPKETDRQKIIEELKKFIGQELNVKISLVNPRNNKLIVSEREIISANVLELLNQYKIGQVVDAVVSGMASFGVFVKLVDNPEIEGIVYLSELDYRIIDNPKDILNLNDIVKVKILDIKNGKLILSIKATKEDPWQKVNDLYKINDEVKGIVYKFTPFGAIINLSNVQGFVHITDFGGVDEMKKELELGREYNFIISQIKPEEKRIILKLKK
ncbi:MAG: S1 RNA-binding domain-containing protein [Patescibacteria group bacterium]|nr:S1 RNA-binding domain-containing protein [Patescibacteria group bacterium]MDW8279945.1 S1 RNA-binding domain-containing protein [bacterium]